MYKKLSSSISLISLLLENNISFSAQVKIPHHEKPIFSIFHLFVEAYIERQTILTDCGSLGDYENYFFIILECYLKHLKIEVNYEKKNLLEKFYGDVRDYGFLESFRILFHLRFCGIYFEKLNTLEDLCQSTNENCDLLWRELEK